MGIPRTGWTTLVGRKPDRAQPLRLLQATRLERLRHLVRDGRVGGNTFRAKNILELDPAVIKNFAITARQNFIRADIFNFINRANFGIPVRLLEAAGFGKATDTVMQARRVQFAVKYSF